MEVELIKDAEPCAAVAMAEDTPAPEMSRKRKRPDDDSGKGGLEDPALPQVGEKEAHGEVAEEYEPRGKKPKVAGHDAAASGPGDGASGPVVCGESGEGGRDEDPAPGGILALPVEILQYIFTYLPIDDLMHLEVVCRTWRAAVSL